MYAIFEDGSHQFRVSQGDTIVVDHRDVEKGGTIEFGNVLLIGGTGSPVIGAPAVVGAKVVAQVVEGFKDKKIIIQKFRRRKNMRRRNGHRQPHLRVKITDVIVPA
jgi:large subunit ribosomal protein L21